MQGDGPLAFLPFWGIFIATLLLVLLSVEGGYRWARYKQKRSEQEKEAPVGAMVGATLGLLAFTLGMAADAFHARKQALVEEANAIGTTYLRAGLIPEPHRTEVRQVLREYVEERLQYAGVEKVQGVRSSK